MPAIVAAIGCTTQQQRGRLASDHGPSICCGSDAMSERNDTSDATTRRGRAAAVAVLAALLLAVVAGVVVWTDRAEPPATTAQPPAETAEPAAPAEPSDAASPPRSVAARARPAGDAASAPGVSDAPAGAPPPVVPEVASTGLPTVPTPEGKATIAEVRAEARSAAAERAESAARERSEQVVAAAAMSAAPSDPLADVLAALPGRPHRWQWGTAEPRSDGTASRAWLAEVQRAAGSAWRPQATVTLTGQALVLSNEAGVVGRLELVDGGVLWYAGAAPRLGWRADLPPDAVQRLRGALAAWAGP